MTDHIGYFDQIRLVLDAAPDLAHIVFSKAVTHGSELISSNFERKYITLRWAFYTAVRMRYR